MPLGRSASYDAVDMMCIAAAREIMDGERVLAGMGPPLLACALAKAVTSPGMTYVTESGPFDWVPSLEHGRAPYQIADPVLTEDSAMVTDMLDALGLFLMGGGTDVAVLQAAQIDRFGNVNTMLVGSYEQPKRRFPGTGGNCDAGASAKRVIMMAPLEERRFRERVDFRTTAGYLDGPGQRRLAGLSPQGPNACVTTSGVLRFDTGDGGESGSCEMYLDGLFPGCTVEDVRQLIPWDLKVAQHVWEIEPPAPSELQALHSLDADRTHRVPGRYAR